MKGSLAICRYHLPAYTRLALLSALSPCSGVLLKEYFSPMKIMNHMLVLESTLKECASMTCNPTGTCLCPIDSKHGTPIVI